MPVDVFDMVRNCVACAKQQIKLRKHVSLLKLFPSKQPVEYVAIDLEATASHEIGARLYTGHVSSYAVAQASCNEWIYHYGPPEYLLLDRDCKFGSSFFNAICGILGIARDFTSAYHPQTNGQVKRFNRTILAALPAFCTESGTCWDSFNSAIAYGYNRTGHRATGLTCFDLILTQPHPLSPCSGRRI